MKEREDLHKSPFIRDLYSINFNKSAADPESQLGSLEKSFEVE
jgi:hypothetical protein